MRFKFVAALFVLLALQFTPGVGIGAAAAGCTFNGWNTSNSCTDRPSAYALVEQAKAHFAPIYPTVTFSVYVVVSGANSIYQFSPSYTGFSAYWPTANSCPAGTAWNDTSHTCFSSAACLAKNDDAAKPTVILFTGAACVEGCEYGALSMNTITVGGSTIRQGEAGFTGNSCGTAPPPPGGFDYKTAPPQQCLEITGQHVCVKPNGEHCYSGPVGRPMQFCWRPGETGQKTSGDVMQVRGAGTATPTATAPAGETVSAVDPPMQSTSSMTSGANVTTTTQNFTTANGTDAGTVDQGEPADGSGSPAGSPGDDGDGSAVGGQGCDSPPVVTGDPILANIVLQTWGTRCAIESGKAVKSIGDIGDCSASWSVTGPEDDPNVAKLKAARAAVCGGAVTSSGDISDCDSAWSISGAPGDPNVETLKAARANICGPEKGDGNADGQPDWTEGAAPTVPGDGDPAPGDEPGPPSDLTVGTNLLDMSGILGTTAAAPSLGVIDFGELGSFDMDSVPFWADLVALMHSIVLLVCAFVSIRILMGGF